MTNVQSPGSQSSKGSSSFDQDYISASAPTVPDVLANFINNNYGNSNYYVADFESNFLRQMLTCDGRKSGIVRRHLAYFEWSLSLNISLILSPSFADADGASNADGFGLDEIDEIDTNQMQIYDGAPVKSRRPDVYNDGKQQQQQQVKQEPVPDTIEQQVSNSGKSLLKNIETPIDADLMLNTLNEVTGDGGVAGTSSVIDPIFDVSQVNWMLFWNRSKYSMFSF